MENKIAIKKIIEFLQKKFRTNKIFIYLPRNMKRQVSISVK